MKKMIIGLILMFGLSHVQASELGDQITASLIEHVAAHSQWTTKGENRLALLASIIQIGKIDKSSIAQIRFGYNAVASGEDVKRSAGYVGDVYINFSPFIRRYVNFDKDWTFLNTIEIGPSYSYDFYQHHSYLAVSVGLAFSLNPKS